MYDYLRATDSKYGESNDDVEENFQMQQFKTVTGRLTGQPGSSTMLSC